VGNEREAPASNCGRQGCRRARGAPRAAEERHHLRIVEFPPDSAWRHGTDGKDGFKSIGAGHGRTARRPTR
jgi:hypothetical protein